MTFRSICLVALALACAVPASAQATFPPGVTPPVFVQPSLQTVASPFSVVSGAKSVNLIHNGTDGVLFTNATGGNLLFATGTATGVTTNGARFTSTTGFVLASSAGLGWSSTTDPSAAPDLSFTRVAAGEYATTAVLFASLGTPANGTFAYCSDCTVANPCAGAGTGAFAKRLAGAWVCN